MMLMRGIVMKNIRGFNNKGFTLIELIVVITILAILVAVVVPSYIGYRDKARTTVCLSNCVQLERMYKMHLILENADHSEALFNQYMQEYGEDLCPGEGDIGYYDGKVQCSVHSKGDGNDGSVPFL